MRGEEAGIGACGCSLFLFRWSWAERCSLPSREGVLSALAFVLLSLTVFLKPCPESCGLTQRKPQQKLQEAQSIDSVASPLCLLGMENVFQLLFA